MLRALCEACGARQPVDWVAADLCVACGHAVRSEVRCAGCAEWTPAGGFCRACGSELIELEHYGAARMLRAAGVDAFALRERFDRLQPAQIDTLQRRFDVQHGIMLRRIEELQLAQTALLDSGHVAALEEQLIPLLPLSPVELEKYEGGPVGPFMNRAELLPEIARSSPLDVTRSLAWMAAYRLGLLDDLAPVRDALSEAPPVALEAALLLGHWRTLLDKAASQLPYLRMAQIAAPALEIRHLAGWAAVTCARALEWVGRSHWERNSREQQYREALGPYSDELIRDRLREALDSTDLELAFAAAVMLPDAERLLLQQDSPVPGRRTLVRRILASQAHPGIASTLLVGSDEEDGELIRRLPDGELPAVFLEALMQAIERRGPGLRSKAASRLDHQLDSELVRRIVAVAVREHDAGLGHVLAHCNSLPDSEWVARQLLESGLLKPDWVHRWLRDPSRAGTGIAAFLAEGNDAVRLAAIRAVENHGQVGAHVEALVQAIERGGANVRDWAISCVRKHLTAELVRRVTAVAVREQDEKLARALLIDKELPELEWAAGQIMDARVITSHAGGYDSAVASLARAGTLSGEFVLHWLEAQTDEATIRNSMHVLELALERSGHMGLWRRMVELSWTGSSALRVEISQALGRNARLAGGPARLQHAWEAFADQGAALAALLPALRDHATLGVYDRHDWITRLLDTIEPAAWRSFAEDVPLTRSVLSALLQVCTNVQLDEYLRGRAARLVCRMAKVPVQRQRVLEQVKLLLETAPVVDLNRHFAELHDTR